MAEPPPRPAKTQCPAPAGTAHLLGQDALLFLADLHHRFEPVRQRLLQARRHRQGLWDQGERLAFLPRSGGILSAWRVPPAPSDLRDRRVEITGPTERKMMVNALNSGAKVFMADFEDATSPTWGNLLEGQRNLHDYVHGRLEHTGPDGKAYQVGPDPATLVVRPRGWHLPERHLLVDGQPMSGSLFDAGTFLFHNAAALLSRGSGPYLYLPKMEHHLEARLWEQVLSFCEDQLALPHGSIRVTVLIETLPAAFQMEEILYELRDRACGLNAGRWDYLFSTLKVHRNHASALLPDRGRITMTVPFLRAYTRLLVRTCHARGAHAMGGMSAFIPNRRDPAVTERAFAQVRDDKLREALDGFDGTWVAHPDLVPVAKEVFDAAFGTRTDQIEQLPEAEVTAEALVDLRVPGAATLEGLRHNLRAAFLYLSAWLGGTGAVAIDNLMEDAATAEISRTQAWQWVRHGARLDDGRTVDMALVDSLLDEQAAAAPPSPHAETARRILRDAIRAPVLPDFLTLIAYERLESTP
ncbi:MAG TPA: malate synthase A [Candidatus Thermoplasmatota archaeon]|nr:malate synthase A [Candidatus Thermoplasmatota archaeon]